MNHHQPRANKTDSGNGSKAICRVGNVHSSPSPDPERNPKKYHDQDNHHLRKPSLLDLFLSVETPISQPCH
jgi:hypothetical protein